MYQMNLVNNSLEPLSRFETKENPYYFGWLYYETMWQNHIV
jgi:hypothetical protein